MKRNHEILMIFSLLMFITFGCKYVYIPEDLISAKTDYLAWSAVVTGVSQTDAGDLHVDVTIQNETGEWSSMQAVVGKPAILKSGGTQSTCDTVYIGTGGHRLAPGLQIRGYTTGTKAEPTTQLLYVECAGVQVEKGAALFINYVAYNGDLDYYHQDANESSGTLELSLDDIVMDLSYPVFTEIPGLAETEGSGILAISQNVVTLTGVQRTEDGLELSWKNFNPTNFALKTHIGNPPLIGSDGIIYGIFEIMDMAETPLTPSKGEANWTTKVKAPADVSGFYILLSVEDQQMRWYVNHLIDITGY
ncbi:MAG: hypothetical protein JW704_10240 [Anaerolineaceae bacterium]|nr:hypothetical protein [Anaerolineaceae bacterium]MBN2677854.1 hypothetical protein [Anaerolineaceae bacterium]